MAPSAVGIWYASNVLPPCERDACSNSTPPFERTLLWGGIPRPSGPVETQSTEIPCPSSGLGPTRSGPAGQQMTAGRFPSARRVLHALAAPIRTPADLSEALGLLEALFAQ